LLPSTNPRKLCEVLKQSINVNEYDFTEDEIADILNAEGDAGVIARAEHYYEAEVNNE